jgi:hypothetical protein
LTKRSQEVFEETVEDQSFVRKLRHFDSSKNPQMSPRGSGALQHGTNQGMEQREYQDHAELRDQRQKDRSRAKFARGRRRSSQEDYEESEDQTWVERIKSFNSLTGESLQAQAKPARSYDPMKTLKEENRVRDDIPIQRSHSKSQTSRHQRTTTLDNWKAMAAQMREQNKPVFPAHPRTDHDRPMFGHSNGSSPAGSNHSTKSRPVHRRNDTLELWKQKQGKSSRGQDFNRSSPFNESGFQSIQEDNQSASSVPKHRHKRTNTLDEWKSQLQVQKAEEARQKTQEEFKEIEDQQWTNRVKAQDTLKRYKAPPALSMNMFAAPEATVEEVDEEEEIGAPGSDNTVVRRHQRTNTLENWKNLAREHQNMAEHRAQQDDFRQIEDQQWTNRVKAQDTLKRHKAPPKLSMGMFSAPEETLEEEEEEMEASDARKISPENEIRVCVRNLLQAIAILYKDQTINADQRRILKEWTLSKNSKLFQLALTTPARALPSVLFDHLSSVE